MSPRHHHHHEGPDHPDGPHPPPGPHHPPGRHGHHRPHPPDPATEVMRRLARHGHVRDLEGLIRLADQLGRPDVAKMLIEIQTTCADAPLGLALDYLEVQLGLEAHRRSQEFRSAAAGKRVALVIPLPPHLHDHLGDLPGAELLVPSGHRLPPHLERQLGKVVEGSRHCRHAIGEFQVVVVEAFRVGNEMLGDAEVVDVVEARRADARVHVHLRPHRHHEDVPFGLDLEHAFVL